MNGRIEHANLSVGNLEEGIRFFQTAFPDWKVRGGNDGDNNRWVHIGTDDTYLCLNAAVAPDGDRQRGHKGYGFNHIGFIVEDAEGVRQRLLDAGFREGFTAEYHAHRTRIYMLDADGIEYEFVEYHSDDPSERNQYT